MLQVLYTDLDLKAVMKRGARGWEEAGIPAVLGNVCCSTPVTGRVERSRNTVFR